MDIMDYCRKNYGLKGWSKLKYWRSALKSSQRLTSKACASSSKNKDKAVQTEVSEYLRIAKEIDLRITQISEALYLLLVTDKLFKKLQELDYYQQMGKKHIDLIESRLLKKELIPSSEKIYSLFEPHTEWISKGKQNKKVEFGHKILISTCQHHFILHHQVIEAKADVELTIPLADALQSKYQNIES